MYDIQYATVITEIIKHWDAVLSAGIGFKMGCDQTRAEGGFNINPLRRMRFPDNLAQLVNVLGSTVVALGVPGDGVRRGLDWLAYNAGYVAGAIKGSTQSELKAQKVYSE